MSHHAVVTVSRNDRIALADALRQAPPADLIEVRLDALWHQPPDEATATEDLVAILGATDRSLLATLRPARQGGGYDGPEDIRINLLLAAAKAGFAAVDIEDDHADVGAVAAAFAGTGVVMSDHRMADCPSREDGLRVLQSMQDLGGLYDKVAFPTSSFMDTLRALELAHSHAHRNGRPAIAPIGAPAEVRALLPLAGNHATYGHDGSGPVVPGQPALADVQAVWDHWGIGPDDLPGDAEAGWLAVIGDPVGHSLSPRIHNAMLRADGRAQRYGALQVPDSIGAVRLVASVAHRIGLRGLSVTQPLKRHAHDIAACDEVAAGSGAVNCIRFTDSIEGTNTDATALRRLLDGADDVAVLGAGGAACAALWAANDLGIPATFTSRDADRAAEVSKRLDATWVRWSDRDTIAADAWVQATSAPIECRLAGVRTAIELVYKAGPTPFMDQAAAGQAHLTDGKTFLIEQALDAYRFWTGAEPDRAVMEAAL